MQTAATLPPAGGTALAQPQPLPPLRDELKIHPAGNNRDGSPAWHLADPVRNIYREFRRMQHAFRLNGIRGARVEREAYAPQIEAVKALWAFVFNPPAKS